MAFEFKLPDLGEGITEGEVVKWKVSPGDFVEEHQVVVDIETDKAIVEVPSPKKGKVVKLNKEEGALVNVGETLLEIETEAVATEAGAEAAEAEVKEPGGEAPPAEKETERAEAAAKPPEAEIKTPEAEAERPEAAESAKEAPPEASKEAPKETPREESFSIVGKVPVGEEVMASPKARFLAKELGVDLSAVSGSGPGGFITEGDVRGAGGGKPPEAAPEPQKAPAAPPAEAKEAAPPAAPELVSPTGDKWGSVERVPMRGVRRSVAKRLMESQKMTAFVTGMEDADVTDLWELKKRERRAAREKGVHLTFMPFFMKAVKHALTAHPMLNASVDEAREEIVIKKYHNIGVAVMTPDGLMVSVVRDVDKKTIIELAAELQELSAKARERKITLEELKGSSFTITNYGSFGGTYATPIINYPDVAILGTGRVAERPWVKDGAIVIRKVLPLSLTFDHRVVDGADGAQFLNKVKGYLEDPGRIFIESA